MKRIESCRVLYGERRIKRSFSFWVFDIESKSSSMSTLWSKKVGFWGCFERKNGDVFDRRHTSFVGEEGEEEESAWRLKWFLGFTEKGEVVVV